MEELIKVEEQGLEGSFAMEFRESSVKKKYKTWLMNHKDIF